MERYNLAALTKKIYDADIKFFKLKTLKDILEVRKESTFFSILNRLLRAGLFIKIEKDKYLLSESKFNDYSFANFLYQPSYVSFESALNFYGVLSQFPYEICSATPKKPVRKIFQGRAFSYIHIKKELFWGYEKKEDFLIASCEKALLDQLYICAKGYKRINLEEYDFKKINLKKLKSYLKKYPVKTKQVSRAIKELKKYISI